MKSQSLSSIFVERQDCENPSVRKKDSYRTGAIEQDKWRIERARAHRHFKMLIRACHGFGSSVVLYFLLRTFCSTDIPNYRKACLTTWSTSFNIGSTDIFATFPEKLGFSVWFASTWSFGSLNISSTNNW